MTLGSTKSAVASTKQAVLRDVRTASARQGPAPLDPVGEPTKRGASVATAASGQRAIGTPLPKATTAPRATSAPVQEVPAPPRAAPSSGAARVEEVAVRPVPAYADPGIFQEFRNEFVEWFETHPARADKGPEIGPFVSPSPTPIVVPTGVDPQYYAWLRQDPEDGVRRNELQRIDEWANGGVPQRSARPGK